MGGGQEAAAKQGRTSQKRLETTTSWWNDEFNMSAKSSIQEKT